MTKHRQASARPEQPGDGGFQAPTTDDPEARHIGSFGDTEEPEREQTRDRDVSDGSERLADDAR